MSYKKSMKISYVQWSVCIYVFILMMIGTIGLTSGRSSHRQHHRHRRFPLPYVPSSRTIIVDQSGHGNFTSIQSAIDSVPDNNQNWFCIYIKAGTYNEQVKIPEEKPMIYLKGDGRRTTNVVWGEPDIFSGATFLSQADNIVAKSLTFTNSYNYPPENNRNPIRPAAAAAITGDKNGFYRCRFFGFQDTLWDVQGRHYFKLCTIQGAVDFIMGSGQSIYERSTISVITKTMNGLAGYITAQSRSNPSDDNGFVFKDCNVLGDGPAFLGRPWRDYARVLFYRCNMSDIIVPQGWSAWGTAGRENQLTFAEEDCSGPGSDTTQRVKWESKLSPQMVQSLTSMSYIDNEGWISHQPYYMLASP